MFIQTWAAVFHTLAVLRWRCAVCLFASSTFQRSWKSVKVFFSRWPPATREVDRASLLLFNKKPSVDGWTTLFCFQQMLLDKWVLTAAALNPVECLFVQLFFLLVLPVDIRKCWGFFSLSKLMFLGQKKRDVSYKDGHKVCLEMCCAKNHWNFRSCSHWTWQCFSHCRISNLCAYCVH